MIGLNRFIAVILPLVPRSWVRFFAGQYIAGETLSEAVEKANELNGKGIGATLDLLGEDPGTKEECRTAVAAYKDIIDQIEKNALHTGVSLKPSHMGLKLDPQFCLGNIREIADHAGRHGLFVRIDMEDASLKEETMDLYLAVKKDFPNVGIVIQAYLRQAVKDINRMIENKANVRLCKGAYYFENKKTVYKDRAIIRSSYAYLLEKLMDGGCFAAIATHDEHLVFEAIRLIDQFRLSPQDYEFQMLYGVQEDLRQILVEMGYPVRVYVPFGKEWFAYSVRRLKENPAMVSHIVLGGIRRLFKR